MPTTTLRHIGDAAEEEALLAPLGRSLITVIGIDKYAYHNELTNAVSDACAVLRLFKRYGFEELAGAPSLFNEQATFDALTSLVRDQLPLELQPNDSLVIFYAGHGTTVPSNAPDPENANKMITRRTGYLIPADAQENKTARWLRLDIFLEEISNLPARHILVILDACKSGFALSEKFKFRGEGQEGGTIAELAGRVSRRVITSAMHDQKAMDGGGGGNSLFTETLIAAVDNLGADHDGDGYITTTDLFAYTRQQVSDTADRVYQVKQTPDYGYLTGDGGGELVLSLRGDNYNRRRAAETLGVADHIYQLGWLSGDAKRFASAIRHYKTAQELANLGKMPLPSAKLGLGKALLAAGKVEEAARELAELVQNEGEAAPAETQFYLGLARAKRGEYALAMEVLRAWQKRNPDSLDAAWVGAYIDWLGQAERPETGRKLALLVGINQYRDEYRQLGCVNDVKKLMQPALVAHGGFKADNVITLTDSQATRACFVKELQKLQSTTLSDTVVVYFSGLGVPASQLDMFGKNDVENIYLLLYDTNCDSGYLTNGMTADDLHQLMQDIPARRKTLILDTHASDKLIELARREGSYALVLASDTAEVIYEWHANVAGEHICCGMMTFALYQSLLGADAQTLSYGEWLNSAICFAEQASSDPDIYQWRQTPYFNGIKNQHVFGPDDIYLSIFEFSQRRDWPEIPLDELIKLYSIFCHAISVLHPRGHAAFGRAFLSVNAYEQAILALQTAVAQAGDAVPTNLQALALAQFRAGQYPEVLATLRRYAPLARPEEQAMVEELDDLLERLVSSRKYALLVGINKYLSPEVPHLKGARNDVVAMKQILTERWGFQPEDIVELVDAKATRASIFAEFAHLTEIAHREPALFFFAGSGSHDQDSLPTLVPYDGRQADVSDIALEELANLVGKDPTNLVTVLDTGFSGRAFDAMDRTIEPDHRVPVPATRFATEGARLAYFHACQLGAVTILQHVKKTL